MTRILGIDPGSRVTGYGVVDVRRGKSCYVASGCIRTTHDGTSERLGEIFEGIAALIETHAPDAVAVEQVFMARNANSALKLGQARGAALAAAVIVGLPVSRVRGAARQTSGDGNGRRDKSAGTTHGVSVAESADVAVRRRGRRACHCDLSHQYSRRAQRRLNKDDRTYSRQSGIAG